MSTSSSSHILQKELFRSQSDIATESSKEIKGAIQSNLSTLKSTKNLFASYLWHPNIAKPYPQYIEHELVIDLWSRNLNLFQNHSIAGILIHLITSYSIPAFKFGYGNAEYIGINKQGLICHQLSKTKCSVLFGPRIKYDGLDANFIYKFSFKMIAGNIGIGIAENDYTKCHPLLHNMHNLRSSVIWKNGYYHYNKFGRSDRKSIKCGHIEDIFVDNDQVELELDLANVKCFVKNVTNTKIPKHELPIKDLVKYKGSTGYLQIVIGFYDDFGDKNWVKGAGIIEIVDQRGEYVSPQKHSVNQPLV